MRPLLALFFILAIYSSSGYCATSDTLTGDELHLYVSVTNKIYRIKIDKSGLFFADEFFELKLERRKCNSALINSIHGHFNLSLRECKKISSETKLPISKFVKNLLTSEKYLMMSLGDANKFFKDFPNRAIRLRREERNLCTK